MSAASGNEQATTLSAAVDTAASIRAARVTDIPALTELETRCFAYDRFSRRSFQYLLTRAHGLALVAEKAGEVVGYAVVLLHGSTALARLYSMAVDPRHQGLGIGTVLLESAEAAALEAGRAVMRLEVRADNARAISRYRAHGYRDIGRYERYYADDVDALRMERRLAGGARPELARVPYYAQTLDFTCGPACLMMAMRAFHPDLVLDRKLELRLWREATLVYMAGGPAGCEPYGLALAARRRGFAARIYATDDGELFLKSVRSPERREVMRLVREDYREQAAQCAIPVERRALTGEDLAAFLDRGELPIVLISSYRIYGDRDPHWVLVTGHDKRFFYLHDPYIDPSEHKTATDGMNIPVAHAELNRMARYGRARVRAAVVVAGTLAR
jgi:ribosomal protein S18 acetylase RimI-like enzyme